LGTAVAIVDIGGFDATWFAVALALGGLIQGWETHAINEIYDWRSGTDQVDGARALSGGSRVRNFGLLDERGLWLIFSVSSAAIAALTAWVVVARAPWLAILILIGYALGIAYTVPPIAMSYRPFAGEWLGGFPGVLLSGLGAYAIQALSLSPAAAIALAAHALVCTGMLVVHHYADAPMDAAAVPPKRTTVAAPPSRCTRVFRPPRRGGTARRSRTRLASRSRGAIPEPLTCPRKSEIRRGVCGRRAAPRIHREPDRGDGRPGRPERDRRRCR